MWGPCGHHFWVMLGIIWRIGDIAKIIKSLEVFNELSWFGGSKLASFSYVFGVFVCDRLGVGFGADLGAVWAPKWGPKRDPPKQVSGPFLVAFTKKN